MTKPELIEALKRLSHGRVDGVDALADFLMPDAPAPDTAEDIAAMNAMSTESPKKGKGK